MTCQTFGCENPGHQIRETECGFKARKPLACVECDCPIVRCGGCRVRFWELHVCARCTGRGRRAVARTYHGHRDEDWDIDANGWYSNARRVLEDGSDNLLNGIT